MNKPFDIICKALGHIRTTMDYSHLIKMERGCCARWSTFASAVENIREPWRAQALHDMPRIQELAHCGTFWLAVQHCAMAGACDWPLGHGISAENRRISAELGIAPAMRCEPAATWHALEPHPSPSFTACFAGQPFFSGGFGEIPMVTSHLRSNRYLAADLQDCA